MRLGLRRFIPAPRVSGFAIAAVAATSVTLSVASPSTTITTVVTPLLPNTTGAAYASIRPFAVSVLNMATAAAVPPPLASFGTSENPLIGAFTLPLQFPPFDKIGAAHYKPALEEGIARHTKEIDAIANGADAPTFDNTVVAMENSGVLLLRTRTLLSSLTTCHTNDELDAVDLEYAPKLTAHSDKIFLNAKLFARIKALYEQLEVAGSEVAALDGDSKWLLKKYHEDFVRAGALVEAGPKQERLKAINTELATLMTKFAQWNLKEMNGAAVGFTAKDALKGMSEQELAMAAAAATRTPVSTPRHAPGDEAPPQYVIPIFNPTSQPSLASISVPETREKILSASLSRGGRGGTTDTRELIATIAKLRCERAHLLGYESHAAYEVANQMVRVPKTVNDLLGKLAPAAVANAQAEQKELEAVASKMEGTKTAITAANWPYYSERLREERYAYDEATLKPYFELWRVLHDGVFYAASKMYGLRFVECTKDYPVYEETVRVYAIYDDAGHPQHPEADHPRQAGLKKAKGKDGEPFALFIADMYARPSKKGGAWMNGYMVPCALWGTKAIVANHMNVPVPPEGQPALLDLDEVRTLFHEFGHGLHGLLPHVTYPRQASLDDVPRDFVEFPSQVNEMWMLHPEVLANYAKHYETGAPMPAELVDKVQAAKKYGQGYATTEYLAASLLDQAWHQATDVAQLPSTAAEVEAFEQAALTKANIALPAVPPRYRSAYFSHIFGGGYAAGYYAYIWSEILDADAAEFFLDNGGLTAANGRKMRETVLARGTAGDSASFFRNLLGRDPVLEPLLRKRGLTLPTA